MNKLLEAIRDSERIAIAGHIRPDGDCVGSALGLRQYIAENYPGKEITVFLEEVNPKFRFLSGISEIHSEPDGENYDLMIAVDCSDPERLGKFEPIFRSSGTKAVIDHHISNHGFGDIRIIEPDRSSASEIVCTLLDPEKISRRKRSIWGSCTIRAYANIPM